MKKLLLIVEDERLLRDALVEAFFKEDITVITAKDGEEGLAKARSDHPDLILLDVTLPKLDGLSLLEALRKESGGARVPVVILSNDPALGTVWQGVSLGAYQYLVKADWSISRIVDFVREQLNLPAHKK